MKRFFYSLLLAGILFAVVADATKTVSRAEPVAAPDVVAESAILMDAKSGTILYEKDIYSQRYPASITKLLTCLVARKNSELTDIVTFSKEAVFGIERKSSNIGIDVGETLTMEECLYAILLESANEVASAVAEHVGGSIEGFAEMMNQEASALGCRDSHFVNANGLPDENHYTSAYDMALIAREFFADDKLSEIAGTVYYQILPTETQPDDIHLQNHHRLLMGCRYGSKYSYEYTVGGKTGYTDVARQTLVTCAQKGDMRLICVVLKDETPNHYLDTRALFDYGFEAFYCVNPQTILGEEEIAGMVLSNIGDVDYEIQGESTICLPSGVSPEQLDVRIEKGTSASNAYIQFMYQNEEVGRISLICREKQPVLLTKENADGETVPDDIQQEKEQRGKKGIGKILSMAKYFLGVILFMVLGFLGFVFYVRYQQEKERQKRRYEIMQRHRARRNEE